MQPTNAVGRFLIRLGSRWAIVAEVIFLVMLLRACTSEPACPECATGGGGDATTTAPGGSVAGDAGSTPSGGTGGVAATGGMGGITETTTSTTTTGGAGGCAPKMYPCMGLACGTADDGCGVEVTCGTCGAGQVCTAGACCTQKTCAEYPGACKNAVEPDGCGGMIACGDAKCGDGLWMNCKAGACACLAAAIWIPDDPMPQQTCDTVMFGSVAYFCGADTTEAPPGCVFTDAQILSAEGQPWLWCCQ